MQYHFIICKNTNSFTTNYLLHVRPSQTLSQDTRTRFWKIVALEGRHWHLRAVLYKWRAPATVFSRGGEGHYPYWNTSGDLGVKLFGISWSSDNTLKWLCAQLAPLAAIVATEFDCCRRLSFVVRSLVSIKIAMSDIKRNTLLQYWHHFNRLYGLFVLDNLLFFTFVK